MELKGKITIDGVESEFMLLDDGGWTQWGVNQFTAGGRVDLLDTLSQAYMEWQGENLCKTCKDHLLDDGEGYDGECGDCADRSDAAVRTVGARVIWTDPDGGQRKAGVVESADDDQETVYIAFDDGGYAEAPTDEVEVEED